MAKPIKVEVRHLRTLQGNAVVELTAVQLENMAERTKKELLEKAARQAAGQPADDDLGVYIEWR